MSVLQTGSRKLIKPVKRGLCRIRSPSKILALAFKRAAPLRAMLRRLRRPDVAYIGVTGSCGKTTTTKLIEAAGYPERPTGPNRLRLLLVGLALALGASAVAVVLAEQVDTSFRRVEEVRAEAPMPVLSTIPRIATEQDRSRRVRQQRLASAAVAVGLVLVASTSFVVARDNQTLVSLLIAEPASSRR